VLNIAFKEWAVICRALADGKQALILRKGGIAETGGEFRPEHSRFWLYPTYLHEHRDGVNPAAQTLFDQVEADRPPPGRLVLTHFADVAGVFQASKWEQVAALNDLHVWSEDAVRMKFIYRNPGVFVLPVRIFRASQPIEVEETPAYHGCRTWVELDQRLSTGGATRAVDDETFATVLQEIGRRLTAS
jgi:hypothetical protein